MSKIKILRIRKIKDGYITEIEVSRWTLFGIRRRWVPYLTYRGTDEAFPFSSRLGAKEAIVREIREELS